MHIKVTIAVVAMSMIQVAPVGAQQAAPPKVAAPAKATAPATPAAAPSKKKACRATALGKKLKGPDYVASIKACIQQAKTDCAKEAASKKVERTKRRDYMLSCLG